MDQTKAAFQHGNEQLTMLEQKAGMAHSAHEDTCNKQLYAALDQWQSSGAGED